MSKYRIGELVGRGGMGQVHSSQDESGHPVVIKRLRNTLIGNRSMAERLSGEAQLAERVMHHNVVRVVDRGRDPAGAPYMVMEHATGEPLSTIIDRDGALSMQRAFGIATQLLAGLGAIHEAGVIHADIKAANILVGTEDRVTIIDFGLSRPIGQANVDDVFAGTPAYMAPEVIDGAAPTVAADLYSVGIVLYEMLTGATPFATSSDIFASHLDDPVVPPSLRAPNVGISSAMDRLVVRLLAKSPNARFGSARELAAALDVVAATAWAMSTVDIAFEGRPTRRKLGPTAPIALATGTQAPPPSAPAPAQSAPSSSAAAQSAPSPSARSAPAQSTPGPSAQFAPSASMETAIPRSALPAIPTLTQTHANPPLVARPPLPDLARVHERIAETLDRAGRMITSRDVQAAIAELEHGLAALVPEQPAYGVPLDPEAWRIESVLAALYDGLGKKERATRLAMAAHRHATRTGCTIAIARTRELCERLERRPQMPAQLAKGSSRFRRPR